jgi:hypothetical protein
MAKAIKDAGGNIIGYEPGIIYDLGFYDPETNTRNPFYVGETTNHKIRLDRHKQEGKNPKPDAEDKYHFIKQLNDRDLKWDMKELGTYGNDGPADLEDEWVMKYLFDGITLTNMVRGSDRWIKNMEDRDKVSADMKQRGISSYKKYKEILTEEEREIQRLAKHAEWMRKEEERTEKEKIQARAEEVRRQIEIEMAARREEQVRIEKEKAERMDKLKAEATAKWEIDRPAREARMKAEAEERAAAAIEKQRQYESLQRVLAEREAERMVEAARLAKQKAEEWEKASSGFRTAQEEERVALQQQAADSMVAFRKVMKLMLIDDRRFKP